MDPNPDTQLSNSIVDHLHAGLVAHATDWHLRQPQSRLRVNGSMVRFPDECQQPTQEELIVFLQQTHESASDVARFLDDRRTAIDWGFNIDIGEFGRIRFRGTGCWTRNGLKIVLRHIPSHVPTMDEIGLPEALQADIKSCPRKGLILVGGATGSGKTTVIASIISYLINNAAMAVQTLEDPVEYLHEDATGIIDQLERGHDFEDFPAAFKSSMRCNPNILLYGELRDEETISSAITASESGHLVFATIHAVDAAGAISRLVDGTSERHQNQIRTQLAGCLRSVICIKLLPTVDKIAKKEIKNGVIAAHEVCIVNAAVANHIREWQPHQIIAEIDGKNPGMQPMDTAIAWLVKDGYISHEVGKSFANNPHAFDLLCRALPLSARPKKRPFRV